MQSGKKVLLVFFALLVATLAFVFYVGYTGGGTASRPAPASAPTSPTPPASSAGTARGAKHATNRTRRDDVRRRIREAWAASDAGDAGDGRDAGALDPSYVQDVLRQDVIPVAMKCYEELLVRGAHDGGRLDIEVTIAADDKLGGIVEEAGIAKTSALRDDTMDACVRESLLTVALPSAPQRGVVTHVAPIEFNRIR